MPIKYKINVLSALKGVGYSTYRLRKEKVFNETVIQKFRNNELVTADNLALVCQMLNCQPGDILEYVPEDNSGEPSE
ncbi:MAG: helix-turn-helix domain-containing protein [Oscillospiraceae bacterium]